MPDEVNLSGRVGRPQVHSQNIKRSVDLATGFKSISKLIRYTYRRRRRPTTPPTGSRNAYLISTSFSVMASFTTSLTHGGGVIGRRSCQIPSARFAPRVTINANRAHLIAKATHSRTYRLLVDLETVYPPIHPTRLRGRGRSGRALMDGIGARTRMRRCWRV